MAKGDRWSDDPDVKVREMRNAETVLGITARFAPLAGERGVYGLAGAPEDKRAMAQARAS